MPQKLCPRAHRGFCWLHVALLAPFAVAEDDLSRTSAARALLDKGKPLEALEAARVALEFSPDGLEVLKLASQAAEAAKQIDEAILYAALAAERAVELEVDAKEIAKIEERVTSLDPLQEQTRKLIEGHTQSLLSLADGAMSRKLYGNAVDLYLKCEGTKAQKKANEALAKIYGNKKILETLFDSGVPVRLGSKRDYSPERLARLDAAHSDWEKAHELKGDRYTIKTNLSYVVGAEMALAMEQVSRFYEKVFSQKQRGRCVISVYKSRADFDKNEGEKSPTVRGFFRPGQNYVATYDPQSDNLPFSRLWSTLFHEASHQFTEMISTGTVPAWLNEGTASYFEGARLREGGLVETNLIPEHRLEALVVHIKEADPTLKEVVSFFKDGSYPAEYYPFGWGLVYFMHNFEDEKCERVYLKPYQDFLKSYKTGEKHDPLKRFEDFFVKRPKQQGIDSFESFEGRFEAWINELFDLEFGPPDRADLLIERARKQRQFGKLEAALESYRWALRKRPGSIPALFEMAQVHEEMKNKDGAIFNYREAMEATRRLDSSSEVPGLDSTTAEALLQDCLTRIAGLDKRLAEGLGKSENEFAAAVTALAKEYWSKELPRRALATLDNAIEMVGDHGDLIAARADIQGLSGVETRRWRRLNVEPELARWSRSDIFRAAAEGLTATATRGLHFAFYREDLTADYRFEANIAVVDPTPKAVVGLIYGAGTRTAPQLLAAIGIGLIDLSELDEGLKQVKDIAELDPKKLQGMNFAVELKSGRAEFFVDGVAVGSHEYPPGAIEGGVGVCIQGCEAKFSDLRVLY